jgi:hypothetical protein
MNRPQSNFTADETKRKNIYEQSNLLIRFQSHVTERFNHLLNNLKTTCLNREIFCRELICQITMRSKYLDSSFISQKKNQYILPSGLGFSQKKTANHKIQQLGQETQDNAYTTYLQQPSQGAFHSSNKGSLKENHRILLSAKT